VLQLRLSPTHSECGRPTVSLLAFAGCGKKGDSSRSSTGEVQVIDATWFRPAFATAPVETKAIVDNVMMSYQASRYLDALAGLDKLAKTSTLTEPQTKAVADLTDQLKKKMAASAPRPSP
jgi:hypothetical protein